MENTLIISQIFFYFTASFVFIVVGILFSLVLYYFICIARELKTITHNFHNLTDEAQKRLKDIVGHLGELPVFSFFKSRRTQFNKNKKDKGKINN